jgi:hypothetical protein
MKIIIKESQYKKLQETIRASQAYRDDSALQTVIDGDRGIAWVIPNQIENLEEKIKEADLNFIKVVENPHNPYIVYRDGYYDNALELHNIAKKYDGYLAWYATEEDSIRIGQLLEYDEDDIKSYILRNRLIRTGNVTCKECDWSWPITDGGEDKFVCHKCGEDNSKLYDGVS